MGNFLLNLSPPVPAREVPFAGLDPQPSDATLLLPLALVHPPLTHKKSWPGCRSKRPSPAKIFSPWLLCWLLPISSRVRPVARREVNMTTPSWPAGLRLESPEIGATPLVRHFLQRLHLPALFEQHLPSLPGRQPALPTSVTLSVLLTNLLLARQPLYAL